MKAKLLFTAICCATLMFAQNTFDYTRSWGTYFGASGTDINDWFACPTIHTDSQHNVYVSGMTYKLENNAPYYNHFITAGAQGFNLIGENYLDAKISSAGSKLWYSYNGFSESFSETFDLLAHIDAQNHQYHLNYGRNITVEPGTAGTWFPNDPQPGHNRRITLSKTDAAGTQQWATFLPVFDVFYDDRFEILTDEDQNIYVFGTTSLQNLATPGVFQTQYLSGIYFDHNHYIAKLNPQGQMLWTTYFPESIFSPAYHNGSLYFLTSRTFNTGVNLSTPGALQQTPAAQAILKINAANGQRIWGTYYNPEEYNASDNKAFTLKVNDEGLFISGRASATNIPAAATYYSTIGSFQPAISGNSDLFLTKFNHDGTRAWGTYYGSNGDDNSDGASMMDLKGNTIMICGQSNKGAAPYQNIATAGAFMQQPSTMNNTLFFSKFDTNGNRIWTSYYATENLIPVLNNSTQQNIGVKMSSENIFYLFGGTTSDQGVATAGAMQPNIPMQISYYPTGFLAKFEKSTTLGTGEMDVSDGIQLYSNPNNGNFYLKGKILQKEVCKISIFDTSGRLVLNRSLEKSDNQLVETTLPTGNYVVNVAGSNTKYGLKMIVK